MGLLLSGMDVLAAEIVILLLLALYFTCRQYHSRVPAAVAFGKCTKGSYLPSENSAGNRRDSEASDNKHCSQ